MISLKVNYISVRPQCEREHVTNLNKSFEISEQNKGEAVGARDDRVIRAESGVNLLYICLVWTALPVITDQREWYTDKVTLQFSPLQLYIWVRSELGPDISVFGDVTENLICQSGAAYWATSTDGRNLLRMLKIREIRLDIMVKVLIVMSERTRRI